MPAAFRVMSQPQACGDSHRLAFQPDVGINLAHLRSLCGFVECEAALSADTSCANGFRVGVDFWNLGGRIKVDIVDLRL